MCNLFRLEKPHAAVAHFARELTRAIAYPEGIPNWEPRPEIRITERAPIIRLGPSGDPELVQRRWSWPGPGGKPVYNFRSEEREFPTGRCLILADGFFEFTAHTDPKSKRKHKWLFTLRNSPFFAIAGLLRSDPATGEAFTMLTAEPGPDVAPYHHRGIIVLPPAQCQQWLDPDIPAAELLKPLPAGSLVVEQVN
jgi:putative SOS response-associated peptidase YedK